MTDKDFYLGFHGYTPGTPEAEAAWADKEAMTRGERFLPCPLVFVAQDIRYDSPIDGRPITSKQARQEDLARSGCIEYDPGMRTDYQRRLKESDEQLGKKVEATIEREFATMPSAKREKLAAEIQGGLTVEPQRQGA